MTLAGSSPPPGATRAQDKWATPANKDVILARAGCGVHRAVLLWNELEKDSAEPSRAGGARSRYSRVTRFLGAGFPRVGRGGAARRGGAGRAYVAAAGACVAGGHLGGGGWRTVLLSASSSSLGSPNVPTSLSPRFSVAKQNSLGSPGEHQRGCMRAAAAWDEGAKGRSPCEEGPAGCRRHSRRGYFRSHAVVHSGRGLVEQAECSPGTSALRKASRPRR